MSEESQESSPAGAEKSPSRLVPILLVLNSVLLAGGLAFFALRAAPASAAKEEAPAAKGASGEGAVGSGAGPTVRLADFVIHLRNPEADRYARLSFELELIAEEDKAILTPYLPHIRDSFISYLSDRTAEELRGSEGLERIKRDLQKQIETVVPGRHVRNLYIAEFVLQ